MDKDALGRRLLEVALLKGDFVLRSGRRSPYYLDKYLFETNPEVLRGVTEALGALVRGQRDGGMRVDRLAAPELGAVALAAALSLELQIPFIIVRKGEKDYGTGKVLEGVCSAGERVAVVEDVVTSGGAALGAVGRLRDAGLVVEGVFSVLDRDGGGREAMAKEGLKYFPLFTWRELGLGEQ